MNVLLFDIDGTLLSSGGAGSAAMYAALESEFGAQEPGGRVAMGGRTDRAIGRDLFLLHDIANSEENWQRFCTAYLDSLPALLRGRQGSLLPGVTDLLDGLQRRSDVAVGLLTGNMRRGADLKLQHYGIAHHFRFGGFGDQHFDRADVGRDAMTSLRDHVAEPRSVLVIGDTPFDIHCARSIGAKAVAVATGGHAAGELAAANPDLLVDDFSDAAPILDLLA